MSWNGEEGDAKEMRCDDEGGKAGLEMGTVYAIFFWMVVAW